jgi:hypothetical protein
MILTNRLFDRQPASKEAKSLYIFCEGLRREYQYFRFFREDNNSPLGLFKIAKENICKTKDNPKPKYKFQRNDEVWIVLDTDPDKGNSREKQINEIKKRCENLTGWYIVESNPCFEVWLYFHLHNSLEEFEEDDFCKSWKLIVNQSIEGGFDSRKHPIFIEEASINSENNYRNFNNRPLKGSTEVYRLAKSILTIMKDKIRAVKKKL